MLSSLKTKMILSFCLVITGCVSSPVITPIGSNVYSVTPQGGAMLNANNFCNQQGKTLFPISVYSAKHDFGFDPDKNLIFACIVPQVDTNPIVPTSPYAY